MTRRLIFVLGDQLDADSAAFDDLDPDRDVVLMAEVAAEATRYPNHKHRIAVFLAAMRHFRDHLEDRGVSVRYRTLDDEDNRGSLPEELGAPLDDLEPAEVCVVEPGRWDLRRELEEVSKDRGYALRVIPDRHFLCSTSNFERWAEGRKTLILETFYRWMRKRTGILMDDGEPVGDRWNFDEKNRESFGKDGPGEIKEPVHHRPDETTRAVLDLVEERFGDHPGSCDTFDWPVTREEALRDLADFMEHRLPRFGPYQDAVWHGRPWLYHSRLSTALNLKLLDPREVIDRAVEAYEEGRASLQSVEGFVRQILGWREFIRGVYGLRMPEYIQRNALDAEASLPDFYWTGDTDMRCIADVVHQLRDHAYAHHIQRLMVTGLFALLYGVRPLEVHEWYMAFYTDSVEWVTLPNTLGMSQYGDGGIVGTKPYIASGKYVDRMSNYCGECRFDPGKSTGDDACPFTTLYWDFLMRHRERFENHPRMALQVRNLDRKDSEELEAIRARAREVRAV